MSSMNNLKQIALACMNYEAANGMLPPGKDANNYSAAVYILPYIEANNIFQSIDMKKPLDELAQNIREQRIKTYESPRDSEAVLPSGFGPTSYLYVAGSKPPLKDNDGIYYADSKTRIPDITDGTSNTIMTVETLRGDGIKKATDVRRQHVLLDGKVLPEIKDETGVDDFQNNRNIAANRCGSWMDGRFLQGTFTATRALNDAKPDVDCGGLGGLSGVRCFGLENAVASWRWIGAFDQTYSGTVNLESTRYAQRRRGNSSGRILRHALEQNFGDPERRSACAPGLFFSCQTRPPEPTISIRTSSSS